MDDANIKTTLQNLESRAKLTVGLLIMFALTEITQANDRPSDEEWAAQIRDDDSIEKVVWVPSQMWKTQQQARIYLSELGVRFQIQQGSACKGKKILVTEQVPKPKLRTLPNGNKEEGNWISTTFGSIALRTNTLPPYKPIPDSNKVTKASISKLYTNRGAPGITLSLRLTKTEVYPGFNTCDTFRYSWPPKIWYSLPEDEGKAYPNMRRQVCPGEVMHVSVKTPYKGITSSPRHTCFR